MMELSDDPIGLYSVYDEFSVYFLSLIVSLRLIASDIATLRKSNMVQHPPNAVLNSLSPL